MSHENILSNLEGIHHRFRDVSHGMSSLSVLPWAHIYGFTCELYYNLLHDNKLAICTEKQQFIKECREVKPDVLYVVPKVLDTVKNKTEFLDKPILRKTLPFALKYLFLSEKRKIHLF